MKIILKFWWNAKENQKRHRNNLIEIENDLHAVSFGQSLINLCNEKGNSSDMYGVEFIMFY